MEIDCKYVWGTYKHFQTVETGRKIVALIIEGDDYRRCVNPNWWCSDKPGHYGAGLKNDDSDVQKVERVGRLGEMAVSKFLHVPVSFDYKERGEVHDFVVGKTKIEVKTALTLPKYEANLIMVESETGRVIPLASDIYISAFCAHEDREKERAVIVLVGWIKRDEIPKQHYRSYVNPKLLLWNVKIPFADTRPLLTLNIEEL